MNTTQILLALVALGLFAIARYLGPIAVARLRENARANTAERVLGFGPMEIKDKSTMIFTAQPRPGFEGSRLLIPAAHADDFTINSISIGKDLVEFGANAIPAAAFVEQGSGPRLSLPPVNADELLLISVSNNSDSPKMFSAALVGRMSVEALS